MANKPAASGPKTQKVNIDQLVVDAGTQPRAHLVQGTINEYAELMEEGTVFPPITVVSDGRSYWVADGFHRTYAAKKLQLREIEAVVLPGDLREAQLVAAAANATHGLTRTWEDKRRAVLMLLSDPEWGAWSDRVIAEKTMTSHVFVGKVRQEAAGGGTASPTKRKTAAGREMDTRGIGKANKDRAEAVLEQVRVVPPATPLAPDPVLIPVPQPVAVRREGDYVLPPPLLQVQEEVNAVEETVAVVLTYLEDLASREDLPRDTLEVALSWTLGVLQTAKALRDRAVWEAEERLGLHAPADPTPGIVMELTYEPDPESNGAAHHDNEWGDGSAPGQANPAVLTAPRTEVTPMFKEPKGKKAKKAARG